MRGIGGMIIRLVLGVILFALFVAFMRAMNWDPLGAFHWFWDTIIEPIANMFSSSQGFKEITKSP